VKGIHQPDEFDRALESLFNAVERAEKRVINVAEMLLHDEVDILFGKDHGHAIHDEKSSEPRVMKQAPVWLL